MIITAYGLTRLERAAGADQTLIHIDQGFAELQFRKGDEYYSERVDGRGPFGLAYEQQDLDRIADRAFAHLNPDVKKKI